MEKIVIPTISNKIENDSQGFITIEFFPTYISLYLDGTCTRKEENEELGIKEEIEATYDWKQKIKKDKIDCIEYDFKYKDGLWAIEIDTVGNTAVMQLGFNNKAETIKVFEQLCDWWLS